MLGLFWIWRICPLSGLRFFRLERIAFIRIVYRLSSVKLWLKWIRIINSLSFKNVLLMDCQVNFAHFVPSLKFHTIEDDSFAVKRKLCFQSILKNSVPTLLHVHPVLNQPIVHKSFFFCHSVTSLAYLQVIH